MKCSARNKIVEKVKSVRKGNIILLVKFDVTTPIEMASALTTEYFFTGQFGTIDLTLTTI